MHCCGLRPKARSRASLPPFPPPPASSHFRLPHCLHKFRASSHHRRRLSFISHCLKKPPPPPAAPPPLLPPFLRSPLPAVDGVDLQPSSAAFSTDRFPPFHHPPVLDLDLDTKTAGPPLVDTKLIAALGDLGVEARRERSCGWGAYVLDRTMSNVVTRAAFVGATTGAVLVGKVALVGATMTMSVACNSLQMFRRMWEPTSGKVTPLPPPHQLPQVAISDWIAPNSDSNRETVEAVSSSPKLCASQTIISSPSPRCVRHAEYQQEDLDLTPCSRTHSSDLGDAVGDLPSSSLDSPYRHSSNRASRMGNSFEKKFSRKSVLCLRSELEESSDLNISHVQQQNLFSLGFYMAIIGLLIDLSGLLGGRILAVLIVVCWLYAMPSLRPTAGEKLAVVSGNFGDVGKADQKCKEKCSSSAVSKREVHPSDYKKRVIMEGFLERDRRPICV